MRHPPSKKTFPITSWFLTPTSSKPSNQGHAAHPFPLPAQTDLSTRAPNPKTFRARIRRWEASTSLPAGTLKLAVITVSIWLVYGTDHPGSLPETDSAHYLSVHTIRFPWYVVTSVATTLLESTLLSNSSVSQPSKINKIAWYLPTSGES